MQLKIIKNELFPNFFLSERFVGPNFLARCFCSLGCKKPNKIVPYFECSAKNNEGVREAFEAAAYASLQVKPPDH